MSNENFNKKSRGSGRTRNYATVVYPDSAPENWKEILGDQCVPCAISPLHDLDLNPDGEKKKAHYHVLLMFDSVKTLEQAKVIFDLIGGVGNEIVQSVRGYARYLCHMDNPEKVQYNPENVVCYGGTDYFDIISIPTDRHKLISEMIDFVNTNNIRYFTDLVDYAKNNRYEWFRTLCDSSAYLMKEYIKSNHYKLDSTIKAINNDLNDLNNN